MKDADARRAWRADPCKRSSLDGRGKVAQQESLHAPFDFEYENIGAGCASVAWTAPPVPMGPAAAEMLPPMVTFPPNANARTASSLFSTMTKSVMSAPIWRPHPTPPVAMHEGADHEPSGSRAMTRPEPALPENTKPALITEKMARPGEFASKGSCTYVLQEELHTYLSRAARRPSG